MKTPEQIALAMVKSWYGRRMSGADFDEPFVKDIAKAITQERERAEILVKALEQAREQNPIRLFIDGWVHTKNCPCYICEALAEYKVGE